MANPFTTGPFTCCTREDETKYIHTCGCPVLEVVSRSRSKTATMCGGKDPDADDGVYYKQIDTIHAGAYIGSGESSVTYSRDEDGVCSSEETPRGDYCDSLFQNEGSYYTTRVITTSSTGSSSGGGGDCSEGSVKTSSISGSYSASTTVTSTKSAGNAGCETTTTTTYTGSSDYNSTQTCCPDYSGCPTTQDSCSSYRNAEDGTWSGTDTTVFFDGTNTTTNSRQISSPCPTTITSSETNTTYQGLVPVVEGSVTYTLADTDEDASEAASWSEWSEIAAGSPTSYDQDRNKLESFDQQESEYAFIAAPLAKGKSYTGYATTQDCTYVKGETEVCTEGVQVDVSFTATDIFKIIGGTLNSSISRDDFVENDYSVNPDDYDDLPDGQDVIESLTPFEVSFGQKRIMNESTVMEMDQV